MLKINLLHASKKMTVGLGAAVAVLGMAVPAFAAFDANVTPDVIFGSGNANGGWTTGTGTAAAGTAAESTVELALRAKIRHNAVGAPENTFNSNADGTYSFSAGVAPTQSSPTAVWSFEWSINTNTGNNPSGLNLDDLTYSLSMTSSTGASITAFDLINATTFDHAIGDNSTGNGGGTNGTSATYAGLIGSNNVAQNSWKPHWFAVGFNPTESGTYDFVLTASYAGIQVASTSMQVIAVVPTPSALIGSAAMLGILGFRRRRRA